MKLIKPLTIGAIVISFAMACGNDPDARKEQTKSLPIQETKLESLEEKHQDNPDYVKGLALIKESDCPSCHMAERKIVGPSYAEVAERYENTQENVELLASRVIKGNVGEWGDIPMPSHPGLSEEDAQQMIRFVLLLRND